MMDIGNLILSVITLVATGGAVYGAIKTDIKHMHEKIGDLKMADMQHDEEIGAVHKRIDDLLIRRRFGDTHN